MTFPPRRKRMLGLLAVLAAFAILAPLGINAASGDPAAEEADAPETFAVADTAVAEHGKLTVCGTKLCDASGEPVQLRGMSTHGLQWYSQCVNDASLDALAYDWGADVVRLSMYIQEDGYETDPAGFTARMHELIEEVTSRGQYVIVDWHQLTPGDPNYNLDRAKTFFTEIAQVHGDKDNIFYEVANEPNGVAWPSIKSYHEAIIPVIRQHDPDSVILLGTAAWSSFGLSGSSSEQEVIDNPVNASNIMYTFHFYAASHDDYYLNGLERATAALPVFVTEFGTQDHAGEGPNDFTMSQRYLDLMERESVSWVNWNYSDDHRSGAVFQTGTCPGGPFTGDGGNLKEAGQWIRDQIRAGGVPGAPPTEEPTDEPTEAPTDDPTEEPTNDSGTWQAGEYYAAGSQVAYGGATYRCLQSHTALTGWEPPNVPALWTHI
ncbi:cellulase family glycosylhydrolase [Glycomyces sp. NRRL B-16210]|uniref:cellulase family glycosylhydrolase n=1 Tax=Glycomyces sp. NRRL B-16210 TaxID=1463821 RepID=UPI0009DF108C|nr:cellulase family glycosylhydrolase [Glycomyces sp. NRRL B-16210]